MGGEGHALDMIRKLKDNRAALHLRRQRQKELYKKILGKSSTEVSDISLEELEKIQAEIKEYEAFSKKRNQRLMLISFGVIVAAVVIIYIVVKIWMK